MKLVVAESSMVAVRSAAKQAAEILTEAIRKKGKARLLLSAGDSLRPFFRELVNQKVSWERVEMFHVDEYVGICCDHPQSTNRFIRKEFLEIVFPGMEHLIMGFLPSEKNVENLTVAIKETPIDLAITSFVEDAVLAWNTEMPCVDEGYTVATLAPADIRRQMMKGYFKNEQDTYSQVITVTSQTIMNCENIISFNFDEKTANEQGRSLMNTMVKGLYEIVQSHKNCTVYCSNAK